MKRRNGNTTRAVDNAIQSLFKTGAIKIPGTLKDEERCSWTNKQVIYDPACIYADVSISEIQRELSVRIKKRLELEHKDVKFDFYSNIIRIKQ